MAMADRRLPRGLNSGKPVNNEGLIIEGWIEGFMLGALIVMCCITVSNMRPGVILHKLILLELILGLCSGVAIFNSPEGYGWYISATGTLMYISYTVHNVVAWMKNRPFLQRRTSLFYICTIILVQPYWILESYANFTYFNGTNLIFNSTRPLETLFRDPWWVWTVISLFWNLKMRYDFTFLEMLHISPRFVILLGSMCLSLCFMVLDILAVTKVLGSVFLTGINPFWKLSFIFKCLTDSVVLDDFKTVLDRLYQVKLGRIRGSTAEDIYQDRADPARDYLVWRQQSAWHPSAAHIEHASPQELYDLSQTTARNKARAATTAAATNPHSSRLNVSSQYDLV